ncbi:hypothetical protein ABFS82_12G022300 [Erythranthe guttata]|uniref:Ribosomal protein L23/L25 N-terminal domain-containing protein n=1 Tax=Erythranthe guttata TaxID=4155 RepID=A0A022RLN0_ERYGU|nr:PREDICTED: 60S ribosomal protein L23a-like [Erythranthe guttata]EYU41372.1 hypothetical protein MIMGU_mgv1a014321mg [Erythranthe guttata]|eukprot:XP_012832628.1 PREDICTED: 60S ribosomal protein L23a-like [Erythranthe guttata]
MIASAVAPPAAAFSSGNWYRGDRVSFLNRFSSGLPSASRKFFPTTAIFHPIEKKVVSLPDFAEIEKIDTLPSTFEDIFIPKPKASSFRNAPKKEKNPKRLSSSAAQRNLLLPVLRYPLTTESAMKAILEHNTLVFVVDERADKNSIKDTVQNVFNVRAKKVNTAITPDGTKKAFIMLASGFSALDVAKKIKIL